MTNQTAQLFDTWALSGRGDKMAEGHWPRVQNFFDDLNLKAGMVCIDVGCGNGYLVRRIGTHIGVEGKAIGIDVSKEMVELATQQSKDIKNTEYRDLIYFLAHYEKLRSGVGKLDSAAEYQSFVHCFF